MYFDALTLAAVADELRDTLIGGRIQKIRLASTHSVGLEIYLDGQRRHLLLSTHPQFARVHLTTERLSRGVEGETQLLLLLRKYVLGGRITAIEQPDLERVLILSIAKPLASRNTTADESAEDEGDDAAEEFWFDPEQLVRSELVIEPMERLGNIILVSDENVIRGSLRVVTPRMSRRPIGPREPYELPPRQDKRDPRWATPEELRTLAAQLAPGNQLAKALVSAYRGISPIVAREVVFRVTGSVDTPTADDLPWARLALTLREIWDGDWQPSLAYDDEGQLIAFAAYRLSHLPKVEELDSISLALERFYATREQLVSYQQRRDALAQSLGEARTKLERLRDQLQQELEQVAQLDRLRWEGEMILGFMHSLRQGQSTFEVEGQAIALDATRTPLENAQDRFRAYDKAKGALAHVPERLRVTEAQLAGLEEIFALLALADSYEQIEDIGREAVEQGYMRAPSKKAKGKRLAPLRVESSDGYALYVGRSTGQNVQVTFKIAAQDDLWLHARNIPGAHVIIKSGGREVPERTLQEAAALAAFYSSGRTENRVDVEIAPRKTVRRVPDGPPALVTYRAERTIRVEPRNIHSAK